MSQTPLKGLLPLRTRFRSCLPSYRSPFDMEEGHTSPEDDCIRVVAEGDGFRDKKVVTILSDRKQLTDTNRCGPIE